MRFIELSSGRILNLERINHIRRGKTISEPETIDYYRDENAAREVTAHLTQDEIEELCSEVIPAAPGFWVTFVEYIGDNDEELVWRLPVIAWRLSNGGATPITIEPL